MARTPTSTYVGRRAVVQHVDGDQFAGLIDQWGDRELVLVEAAQLGDTPGADPLPIDGLLVIDRMQVSWAQVLGE